MLKIDFNSKIGIIGLGYVGLPLAVEFGKKYSTLGFDINSVRIGQLNKGIDVTEEVTSEELSSSKRLSFNDDESSLCECDIFIVTVPTPITKDKTPDLSPLISASRLVSKYIKKNSVVIFESTVYPGATEEVCVPILEDKSGFRLNEGFFVGYSPERINPGDKEHRVSDILKVTSGSTPESALEIDKLYKSVIKAGTYCAESIKVAEAAKVIENTQRDINIALINELAKIFSKLDIDTEQVLNAAGTKWNFLPFKPGLVGGHCIGVDPYYLTSKAQSIGYYPEMILAGRRINDGMSNFVASTLVKKMLSKKIQVNGSKVLLLGLTFKENCPDLRNSKVIDVIKELESYGVNVDVYDPVCDSKEAGDLCPDNYVNMLKSNTYDGLILTVAHSVFKEMSIKDLETLCKEQKVIFDLKHIHDKELVDVRL